MYVFSSSVIAISAAALLAPLTPVAADRADGRTESLPLAALDSSSRGPGTGAMGLSKPDVEPFTMVGVVWKDPEAELHARVQVRVRSAETGRWSGWQDVEAHRADAPDSGSGEGDPAARRGGTAPLWVGDSNGVEVRVRPEKAGTRNAAAALPPGLTAELIDPGTGGPGSARAAGTDTGTGAGNAAVAPAGATEIAAQTRTESAAAAGRPFVGPRPGIVTRKGWGADESRRGQTYTYSKTVNVAFVHHSATGNNYRCSEAPSLIRGIYRYHTRSLAWADLGYNFLVDKCGRTYEGRAGGVTRAVQGAHTYGFNHNSMGIAVLGSFDSSAPSESAVNAVSRLTAWKLGLFGKNPKSKQTKVSGGGKYTGGTRVRLNVISGHRDGFATECPGGRLYDRLGAARASSARYQGRG